MPVINTQKKINKIKLKNKEIDETIYKEINDYCEWVGIDDVSFFIEEAARHAAIPAVYLMNESVQKELEM